MPADSDQRAYRLGAIDLLRGLAIVIMAIDHVRDYCMVSGVLDPMSDPNISPALFATRWITHFCAPVFVLLAGTSAGLMAARKDAVALGGFLLKRGLWLILIEWFVMSTAFTFAPRGIAQFDGHMFVGLQVIWAIGASMVVLAGAQFLGRRACFVIGAAIVLGHNLLDAFWPASGLLEQQWPLWVALHAQMAHTAGPFLFAFVYPLLPWIGVMLLGFGVSPLFELPAAQRNAALLRSGLGLTLAFLVLRGVDVYADPNLWQRQPGGVVATVIDFLNVTKYPPSLDFLLMTLGPAAMLCAVADRCRGVLKDALITFGRVPFAFYVVHFYLIHALAVLLGVLQGFEARQFLTLFFFFPKGYGVGLAGVYAIWILVIALLYPFCRWVAGVKARRRDAWLSYV